MSDTPHRKPDDPETDDPLEEKQETLDRLRGTGVGLEDPNIVGDTDEPDVAPDNDSSTSDGGA